MGAKQERTKGNKQKAKYSKSDGKHGKPGWKEEEKREAKAERETVEATVRRKQWKREKEETEAE